MADSTVDVGRCRRNDGKAWRCKSQCFGGSRYCEKHYDYLDIKSKTRVRVSCRRAEAEGSSTADEDRCVKMNGQGWRCKSRRFVGTRYCKKHHLREASRVRVSGASACKKTKKKQSTGSTVDGDRCTRSDGRGWRCSSPCCGGRRYCEKHYLQRLSGAGSKYKGRVSGASVEEEKLEEGEAHQKAKNLEGIEKKRTRPTIELGGAEEGGRILELGQVWAFPKESDGFPRSYARIDRIIPLPPPSVVRVTPLVPHPITDDEKLLAEQGFSLACGLFKASESAATKEISAFTHKIQFEIDGKQGSFFKIFPKEGEVWAIYLRWDALTKTFDYQLVEVESDFDEEDGVKVFAIVKVEGRDGVYRRQVYAGFHLVRSFSRGFMSMFSHKVPSSRIVEGGELLWKVMLH